MSLETLDTMTFWVFIALVVVSTAFGIRKVRCVRGTHARYVAATIETAGEIGVMISLIVMAVINAAQQDMVFAVTALILALWRLWWFLKSFDDDDHWFNDQWKSLKRGFKKLRQRLANLRPQPLPSPA